MNPINNILEFCKKNKKVNIPLVLIVTPLLPILIAFIFSNIINYILHPSEKYTLILFLKSDLTDTSKLGGILLATFLSISTLYSIFRNHFSNSKNNLGDAKIGSSKDLSNLLGKDGLTLSKNVTLSEKVCFEHVAIVGPTGAGKSSTNFIPNLLSLPKHVSIVISDPKGELYKQTAAYNESLGRKCILFAPLQPEYSLKYNPLEIADSVTEIREIAQNLLVNGANAISASTGKQGGGDSEWINMAVPLWTAALIFCKEQGGKLGTINSALNLILEKSPQELDLILGFASNDVKTQYSIYKQAAGSDKTASSIKTVLSSNLQLFTDPSIVNVTSGTEFNPFELRDTPTAIYIMCPERQSSYASPFMSIFYSQMLNKLMSYSGNNLPIYMLLDEFANIGIIPNFAQLAATCRSRSISLTIGIQGIEQLWQNYGKETGDNILNNMKSKIFYPSLANTTAEIASKLCGHTTILTESVSTNIERGKQNRDVSKSTSHQRRELLDADQIRRLPEDEVLLILHNKPPIIDKQNRFYENSVFTKKIKPVDLPFRGKDDNEQ